jgi:hypothetical protein
LSTIAAEAAPTLLGYESGLIVTWVSQAAYRATAAQMSVDDILIAGASGKLRNVMCAVAHIAEGPPRRED